MKFSISFKYSNVTFKNKETKETISYDTKASEGNTFTFDNVDEDVVIGMLKGIKDRKASQLFTYDDLRTNFINTMARNKCKELYDKLDKNEWKIEDIAVSNITIKDVEFTKPTMNAREAITVESKRKVDESIYDNNLDEALNLLNESAASLHMAMWDINNELGKNHELFKRVERNYNDVHETYGIMEEFMDKGELMNETRETITMESRKMINENVEPVIFKKDRRDGEVVAFFPETIFDGSTNHGNIMCYAHNGQSSEASMDYFNSCRPCKDESEYADLLKELEWYFNQDKDEEPTTLKVVKRMNYKQGGKFRDVWPMRESVNDAARALDDPRYGGVPSHEYIIELADGSERVIDPSEYYGWADVVEIGTENYPNTVIVSDDPDRGAVGLVLNETDLLEIVKVTDTESGEEWEIDTDKTPFQWA